MTARRSSGTPLSSEEKWRGGHLAKALAALRRLRPFLVGENADLKVYLPNRGVVDPAHVHSAIVISTRLA